MNSAPVEVTGVSVEPIKSRDQLTRQRIRCLGRETTKHQIKSQLPGLTRHERRKLERAGNRVAWKQRDKDVVAKLTECR